MKKSKQMIHAAFAVLLSANVLTMTGCGKKVSDSPQTDTAVQYEVSEVQYEASEVQNEGSEIQKKGMQVQTAADAARAQETQQSEEKESVIRAYSDKEKERMKELQESYQNETAKPEKMIQEVDSAEAAAEGALCYIRSTGEYYLPDRELTDEELLEIIDCNFRIALNTNRKTQAEYEAEDRAKRAELEEKVKAADGISEEEAIEIAKKAMENDLGERGKGLKLCINEIYGWSTELCVADWSEIKEKDRGKIAYCIIFNNAEDVMNLEDVVNYNCTVNAADGSILEAYIIQGLGGSTTYYEH